MKNNAKFSGHYVRQRTRNVHTHALRLDQLRILSRASILVSKLLTVEGGGGLDRFWTKSILSFFFFFKITYLKLY